MIEDARRRQRRHWIVAAFAAVVAAVLAGSLALAGGDRGAAAIHGHATVGKTLVAGDRGRARADAVHTSAMSHVSEMGLLAPGDGWAANGIGLYLTNDNGWRWRTLAAPGLTGDVIANLSAVTSAGATLFVSRNAQGYGTCDSPASRNSVNPGRPLATVAISVLDATSDGGRSWRTSIISRCAYATSMSFAGIHTGFVVSPPRASSSRTPAAAGMLYATTNGGQSWRQVGPTPFVGPIDFTSRNDGWGTATSVSAGQPAARRTGLLYHTTDGGRTWRRVRLCSGAANRGVAVICGTPRFFGRLDGVVPVGIVDSRTRKDSLLVYSTDDGGRTWSRHSPPGDPSLRAYFAPRNPYTNADGTRRLAVPFAAANPTHWYIFIGPHLYVTANAGTRWTRITPTPRIGAPSIATNGINDTSPLDFASATSGWIIAGWSSNAPTFAYTTNGGRSWEPLSSH